MANENTIKYVILGLLSHEPMTGYELKKRMDTTMSLFWSGSYGSIYPTLQRLKSQDAIQSSDSEDEVRRGKIRYNITENGRSILREWLKDPVVKDEIRYETLLKMFFGDQIEQEIILNHVDRFEERTVEILPRLRSSVELLNTLKEEPAHEYYMLTAMLGVRMYEASLDWCNDVRKHFAEKEEERL